MAISPRLQLVHLAEASRIGTLGAPIEWTVGRRPAIRSAPRPHTDLPQASDEAMRIVLFRHGPAGSRDPRRWPDDGQRPLSPRGIERTEQAARGLVRIMPLHRIVTSPLLRAAQSAELLRKAVDSKREVEVLDAPARSLPLKKAGVCVIDFVGGPTPGDGKLVAFLPPRFLRRRSATKAKA